MNINSIKVTPVVLKRKIDIENKTNKKYKSAPFDFLPEIIGKITGYCPFQNYRTLSLVNKNWNKIISTSSLIKLYDFIINTSDYINKKKELQLERGMMIDKEVSKLISLNPGNVFDIKSRWIYSLLSPELLDNKRKDYPSLCTVVETITFSAPMILEDFVEQMQPNSSRPSIIDDKIKKLNLFISNLANSAECYLDQEAIQLFSQGIDNGMATRGEEIITIKEVLSQQSAMFAEARNSCIEIGMKKDLSLLLLRLESQEMAHSKTCLSILKGDLNTDKDALLLALKNPVLFKRKQFVNLIKPWKNDYEISLAAVQKDGLKIKNLLKKFQGNIEIVKAAVKNNPLAFVYVLPIMQDNIDVANIAINKNIYTLMYASLKIKKKYVDINIENLFYALKGDDSDIELFEYALKNKPEAVLWLYYNKNMVIQLLSKNGLLLKYFYNLFAFDWDVVSAAVTQNPKALEYVLNKSIVLKILKSNGILFEYVTQSLSSDIDIINSAVTNNPNALQFINDRTAENIILENRSLYKFATKSVQNNYLENWYQSIMSDINSLQWSITTEEVILRLNQIEQKIELEDDLVKNHDKIIMLRNHVFKNKKEWISQLFENIKDEAHNLNLNLFDPFESQ